MPVLNEAENLPARARELVQQEQPWEWIVADGGSSDDSPAIAQSLGASVVRAQRGRGSQLNAGAATANGDVFLFLHADTVLPAGAFAHIRAALLHAGVVGGNFRFAFDDRSFAGRLLTAVYAAKGRLFKVWYGDSGIFVRAAAFRALGGFAPFPIMEDAHFVERLRRAGDTRRLDAVVLASPRRYRGRICATIVRWTGVFALYKLGVAPHRLAALYPPHRPTAAVRRAEGACRAAGGRAAAPREPGASASG